MGMITQLLDGKAYTGTQFMTDLRWLTVILVTIAGALMTLYAVYIGYLFATATDEGKRRAAKTRLFKVLGSALIIFAMASVLKVIDVKFTDVEENNSGGSSGNLQWNDMDFEYAETPTLTITTTVPGTLTLSPKNVRIKDSNQSLSNVKFTGFAITTTAWPYNGATRIGPTTTFGSDGSLTFKYICEPPYADQDIIVVKCLGKEGGTSYFVEASASFDYGDAKGCSVSFYVEIKPNDKRLHMEVIGTITA